MVQRSLRTERSQDAYVQKYNVAQQTCGVHDPLAGLVSPLFVTLEEKKNSQILDFEMDAKNYVRIKKRPMFDYVQQINS